MTANASRRFPDLGDDGTHVVVVVAAAAERLAEELEQLERQVESDPAYTGLREKTSRIVMLGLSVSDTLRELVSGSPVPDSD